MPSQSATGNQSVYPIPQEMQLTAGDLPLATAVIVVGDAPTADEQFAARLLRDWIADDYLVNLPIVAQAPAGAAGIALGVGATRAGVKPVDKPEGYALSIAPSGAAAVGSDRRGLLYAVATLVQLLHRSDGGIFLRGRTIRDWPAMPIRYVHVYVPGQDDIPFFKRYIRDFLLRNKFNGMVMEVGGGVRLQRHPEIATGWRRTVAELYAHGDRSWITGEACPLGHARRFQDSTHVGIGGGAYIEPEDLRDIAAFARAHGVEIVPEIQSLTHVYYLASARRDIAEVPDVLFPDSYCPSNEESYKLLFEIMDEYIDILQPPAVHIGHDEWRTGGDCPKCKQRHTGDLYAQDVIRIYRHLKERGVNVWMWGDHFVSMHCETGGSLGHAGGPVWYLTPNTQGAWKQVRAACPDILLLNWSWSMRGENGNQGVADAELREKGFNFIYGNFYGQDFEDFAARAEKFGVAGAAVSSWCRADEFQLGKMHIFSAQFSAGILWSPRALDRDQAMRWVAELLPTMRQRLLNTHQPDVLLTQPAQETLDLSAYFNSPLKGGGYDLSGLKKGKWRGLGYDVQFGDGAIIVKRANEAIDIHREMPIAAVIVERAVAKLVFWQSSVGEARRMLHAGDGTHFPRESSEAIGVYQVVFSDGMTTFVPIRYDENVSQWDTGDKKLLYHGLNLFAGTLPDGRPLIVWGLEWTNPRPDVPIVSILFRGTAQSFEPSQCRPILLGITAVRKVRLEDYRG